MGGLHLGAVVVGDVALLRLARLPGLVVVLGKPALYFLDLGPKGANVLLFPVPMTS